MSVPPLVRLLRSSNWLKNLMLFFPPLLSGSLGHPGVLTAGFLPLVAFCCASSSTYIFNDLNDRQQDALHPVKCQRPLASGAVGTGPAICLLAILLLIAVLIAWRVSLIFLMYLALYVGISWAYSLWLKNWALLDIFCISFGFVLRLYAGGVAFGVYISDWLFLTVFLLAVFLSFGKRCSERRALGAHAGEHRRTLEDYPPGFLESGMYLSGSTVLVTYAIYATSRPLLVYTVPLCMFGLLRYLLRIKSGAGGDPTEALLKDPLLSLTGALWAILVGWIIYL